MTDVDAFFDRISSDESFAQQLESVREDVDAVHEIALQAGFDLDPVDVRLGFLERFGAELTEEQLAAISGGRASDADTAAIVGGVIAGAGVAIGIGAAAAAI